MKEISSQLSKKYKKVEEEEVKKKAVMERAIIRRQVKENNMEISLLGGLNNGSKKEK